MSANSGFDIIGDVHGHALALEALLETLGYRRRNGAWGHAERAAIFVGDFVDRGPENIRACRIVMEMTAAGHARAVLGNHDFNHLALATPDPDCPGAFLRPHSAKNLHQAERTLEEFKRDPAATGRILEWMRALPLWLDLDRLRIVHAAWSDEAQAVLAPFLTQAGALTKAGLVRAARPGDPIFVARETLLNGPEATLPDGLSFNDKDGYPRREARLRWWLAGCEPALTWSEVFLSPLGASRFPKSPVQEGILGPPDPDPRPVFFGHYWMQWPLEPCSPRHACLDASVGKGGRLAAYRFSGEASLTQTGFVVA